MKTKRSRFARELVREAMTRDAAIVNTLGGWEAEYCKRATGRSFWRMVNRGLNVQVRGLTLADALDQVVEKYVEERDEMVEVEITEANLFVQRVIEIADEFASIENGVRARLRAAVRAFQACR